MQVCLSILTACLIKEGKKPFGDDLTYGFSFMYVLFSLNIVTDMMLIFEFYKCVLSVILSFVAYRGNCEGMASKIFHISDDY